jgi:TATA-binding protein-associated factor Taf7
MSHKDIKKKMPKNTAQEISYSDGELLDKMKHAKSVAVSIDEDVESKKTTCTFEDGSTLTFKKRKKMPKNTAQEISNSDGGLLDKMKHAKSVAVSIDEDVESKKTTCTFEDGSTLTFKERW